MVRPADDMPLSLPEGYVCCAADAENDARDIAEVMSKSYAGGICEEINGVLTPETALDDVKSVFSVYSRVSRPLVIAERATGNIVAVCLAGSGENYVHGCSEIAELCVLPEHRGKGLG